MKTMQHLLAAAFALSLAVPGFTQTGKICIDAGHGGSDPGAVGNGQQEKVNVLNTAIKFKAWLDKDTQDTGGGGSWNIVMTRSTDVFVSLQGRCDIANNNNCNRFMSIHNNGFGDSSANGTETFCHPSGSSNSFDLRNKVHTRTIQAWNRTDRGTKTASFYVLSNTNMPAELAEPGFITNPGDSVYTGSSSHQDNLAKHHMYALQNHYGLTAYTPQTQVTIIVDNNSGNFSASSNWSTGTSATDKYGSDYRFRSTQAVSDAAQWNFNISAAGNYAISAWWSQGTNRSPTAPYILPDGATVNVNQQANGGKWNALGTKNLSSGGHNIRLSCWTGTGYVVMADAVRLIGPQ